MVSTVKKSSKKKKENQLTRIFVCVKHYKRVVSNPEGLQRITVETGGNKRCILIAFGFIPPPPLECGRWRLLYKRFLSFRCSCMKTSQKCLTMETESKKKKRKKSPSIITQREAEEEEELEYSFFFFYFWGKIGFCFIFSLQILIQLWHITVDYYRRLLRPVAP